ncbi:MAG: zinc transport system substrate-binding protein [Halothiobacillaceae bacterium]|nr:MAG: zinc transport system substrate-binding protein [Halothiobacillaceae bacterium]
MVVSIAPVHSLVAGVMAGVAEPELLVKGAASPHSYLLKPSQLQTLQQAELIIWNSESVESFLPRALRSLDAQVPVIKLILLPGMTLLPTRLGGLWVDQKEAGPHAHHGDSIDGHLWLDPANAKVMVAAVTTALSEIDPLHAVQYRHNSEGILQQLDGLTHELNDLLAPTRDIPYLVFHDGYHYFEARFHLNAIGAISVDPERKPGAKRLRELTAMIQQRQVHCLFSEPQYPSSTVQSIVAGSEVKSGVLDPLGSTLPPGPELYFSLMRNLSKSLAECLQ